MCRTRVIGSIFPESDGVVSQRGNLSFTTINLPRIGIKHGICLGERTTPDWDGFYKELEEMFMLVKEQLMDRYKIQCNKRVKNFPFLLGQNNWLKAEGLDENDTLESVLKHGTISIGCIGLAETLKAMIGQHHGESDEAQQKGLEIIGYLRRRCDEESIKDQMNVTLLATPKNWAVI